MTIEDLDGVVAVAALAFPDHFEERVRFEERLMLSPSSCFVLVDPYRVVMGYLIAFPWPLDRVPPLNSAIGAIPEDAEALYIHDLALIPEARGQDYTRAIIDRIIAQAQASGWKAVALVAVNQSVDFWSRNGFEVRDLPGMREMLASYGEDARYMVRNLNS